MSDPRFKSVIAFGLGPEMYFVGVGMHYCAVGLPDSIKVVAKEWPAAQMEWMSINEDGSWIVSDAYSKELKFDLPDELIQRLRTTGAKNYVTFGPTRGAWLGVGLDNSGTWAGAMEHDQIKVVEDIKGQTKDIFDFDTEFRGILFGKGSTMIFMFRGSFAYYTDKDAEGSELENLLNSYLDCSSPWIIERRSALCPWDVSYYFLKFKDPQSGTVKIHWNFPPDMQAHYDELTTLAQTPEMQAAIAQHNQLKLTAIRQEQMQEQIYESMMARNMMNLNLQMAQMQQNRVAEFSALMSLGTQAIAKAASGL